jgi:prepilin-type N-terminal cleavage/methylation domain-containing protein
MFYSTRKERGSTMKIINFRKKGFSLIELMMSLGVLSLVIGMAMTSWLSFMQKSNRINAQAGLDMEARKIIENFRSEMSKTSRESIIFYPENLAPYQAVSFALPADQDGDGLMDMNPATSNILWRQTIVYHIFNQPPKPPQMRRTIFENRNQTATYQQRYDQVQAVVAAGQGTSACLASETTSMRVMFENLFTGRLWHAEARFDGYAPAKSTENPYTRERVTFGATPVNAGAQQITFTIVDKNPLSSGRKFGLDRITANASGWFMEAELLPGTSTIPKTYTGLGGASAGYGLLAATTANGQEINLTVNNDAIEECIFMGDNRNARLSNTVVRLDTDYKPTGFNNGVICAKLDGECTNTWRATEQMLNSSPGYQGNVGWTNYIFVFRIPILADQVLNAQGEPRDFGIRKDGYNPVFRLTKRSDNGGIDIKHASFVIVPKEELPPNGDGTVNNALIGPIIGSEPEIIPLDFWQNGAVTTWRNALPNTSAGATQIVELHNTTRRNIKIPMGSTLMLQLVMTHIPGYTSYNFDTLAQNRWTLPTGCWWWYQWDGTLSNAMVAVSTPDWRVSVTPPAYYFAHAAIPFLKSLVVNYPDEGDFISNVFDTTDISGQQKNILWEVQMPAGGGGDFDFYARSGNSISESGLEIEDASAWDSLSPLSAAPPSTGISIGTGRYVQFKTVFTSQKSHLSPDAGPPTSSSSPGPYRNDTARLRWVKVLFPGQTKYVDVAGELLKGPDCGIFTVKVNGKELVRGVTMEIEIFKDIRGVGGIPLRIKSAVSAEVDPRNSGK